MTSAHLSPALTPAKDIPQALRDDGFAVVSAETVAELSKAPIVNLQNLTQ
jgi:hypothetical protein